MKLIKGIFLASITTPIIVFLLIFLTSLIFTIIEYARIGTTGIQYIGGGAVGGSVYAIFTAYVSIPSTLLIGYPVARYAIYMQQFSRFSVLLGASLLGALVLTIIIFTSKYTEGFLMLAAIVGAFGGLFNGVTLWLYMKKA